MYQEHSPESSIATFVECLWTSDVEKNEQRRILPDGCVDLLFFLNRRQVIDARFVGVMTRAHAVDLSAGQSILGVRFHPGMAGMCLGFDVSRWNDQSVSIELALGGLARDIVHAVRKNPRRDCTLAGLTRAVARLPNIELMREATGESIGRSRPSAANDLGNTATVGERQLRRNCIRQSGLSPKKLSRILRFRRAVQKLRSSRVDLAQIALDCGYCDQSHMNRDFQEFAGQTPVFFVSP